MSIVAKFGGTSMQDKAAMERAAKIVLSNPEIKIVVVSATAGTTNSLLKLAKLFSQVDLYHDHSIIEDTWNAITQRHLNLADELDIPHIKKNIQELFLEAKVVGKTLTKGMSDQNNNYKKQVDRILSIGERSSAMIFGEYLHSKNSDYSSYDVRKIMKTDSSWSHATPLMSEIEKEVKKEILPILKAKKFLVMEGFIGSTLSGNTTTLGRGGSDYSAAILGFMIKASEIQIWTDVPGMFTADPRIIKNARLIEELSFVEASEMCTYGAKVLHPATILPAIEGKIPVKILSTFEPEKKGTAISSAIENPPTFRGITLRKNQSLLIITKNPNKADGKFLSDIFKIFQDFKVPVDLINTSEVNIALTLDESMSPINLNPNLIDRIKEIGKITKIENLALVAVIGNNLKLESVLSSVKSFDFKLINFGASAHNICFLIDENQAIDLIRTLHQTTIEN
jgi:aspartate kinase